MIKIENEDLLNNFTKQHRNLENKLVVVRFKMNGCVHCVNSQPKWDSMIDTIDTSYHVQPNTLFLEIDSNVADNFIQQHNVITENKQPYSVNGFPEHAIITKGVSYPSNSDMDTTVNSIMKQLVKHKHITTKPKKSKKKKSKNKSKKKKRNSLK